MREREEAPPNNKMFALVTGKLMLFLLFYQVSWNVLKVFVISEKYFFIEEISPKAEFPKNAQQIIRCFAKIQKGLI